MKVLFKILTLILVCNEYANCQIYKKPIEWIYEYTPNYEIGDTIEIKYFAKLDKDWYIYSFDTDTVDYVKPATFYLKESDSYRLAEPTKYPESSKVYDEDLKIDIRILKNYFLINQKIIVLKKPFKLSTTIDYFLIRKVNDESGDVMHLQESF